MTLKPYFLILGIIILLLFGSSCKDHVIKLSDHQYMELSGEQFGPKDILNAPDNITIHNGFFIVSDLFNKVSLHILDKGGFLQMDSTFTDFNDKLTQLNAKQLLKGSNFETLNLYNKRENVAYNFNLTSKPIKVTERESLNLPFGFSLVQEISFMNNLIIGAGGRDFKIFIFDTLSNKSLNIKYKKDFEAILSKNENIIPNFNISVNKDLNKFVVSPSILNYVELYNSKGNLLKSVYIDNDFVSQMNDIQSIENKGDFPITFHDSFASNDRIYLLYFNERVSALNINPENFKPMILVFDWKLNLLDVFKLDQLISKFIVTQENELIGITPYTKSQKLVKYKLR